MTKQELITELNKIAKMSGDIEVDHIKADDLLLKYINDNEVTTAFNNILKWYA
jgi:hypothetical protein